MKISAAILAIGTAVLLSACTEGVSRNPGYVCMHDCPHHCPDGIKGDQCRRDIQMQQGPYARDNAEDPHPYPSQVYYFAPVGPQTETTTVSRSPDGTVVKRTTVTSPY